MLVRFLWRWLSQCAFYGEQRTARTTSMPSVIRHCADLVAGTKLHTLVTVVDVSTFLDEFEKRNKVNQRTDLGTDDFSDQNNRQVVDLMCEQASAQGFSDALVAALCVLLGCECAVCSVVMRAPKRAHARAGSGAACGSVDQGEGRSTPADPVSACAAASVRG
eukprot:6183848-Pleurochrysis_carterae.AAC.2